MARLEDVSVPGLEAALDNATGRRETKRLHSQTAVRSDQTAWATAFAQRFRQEEFDVDYSRRHVQRLLREVGRAWRTQ